VSGANLRHDARLQPSPAPTHSPVCQGLGLWLHSTVEHYPYRVLTTSHRPTRAGTDSPSFRRPIGIRARAPSPHGVEQVVRDPLRVRPRAFSTPRRFAQAHVPRLYFAPQPVLGCLSSSFPLAEIARLFPGRFAPLRFLTRVPNATSRTLSPSVSLNRHAPSRRSFQARVSRVPPPTMDSLSPDRSRAPSCPGSKRPGSPLPRTQSPSKL